MSRPGLTDVQAWLHTYVVEPGTDQDALRAAEQKAGLEAGSAENLILPSHSLQPRERISIYRRMYLLRMHEALTVDFPAVEQWVGKERFREVVANYVEKHPSQSYTLDHLGRHFASFLAETNEGESGAWLSELAQLEWALCEIFGEKDSPVLTMSDLHAVDPDDFDRLVLTTIPALRLLSFDYDVNPVYKQWVEDLAMEEPSKKSAWLVCWRQEFELWRSSMTEAAKAFLVALQEKKTLGEAIDQTIGAHESSEEQLFEWFQTWVADGCFAEYSLA